MEPEAATSTDASRKTSEREVGVKAINELASEWAKVDANTARQRALKSYCRAIVNSAGFLYVD